MITGDVQGSLGDKFKDRKYGQRIIVTHLECAVQTSENILY